MKINSPPASAAPPPNTPTTDPGPGCTYGCALLVAAPFFFAAAWLILKMVEIIN